MKFDLWHLLLVGAVVLVGIWAWKKYGGKAL